MARVRNRREFINITPEVKECLRESGIREGFVLYNAMHITASVFINDDESGLSHLWGDGAVAGNLGLLKRKNQLPSFSWRVQNNSQPFSPRAFNRSNSRVSASESGAASTAFWSSPISVRNCRR